MTGALPSYEKLGAFYLGRRFDAESRETSDEDILYDAKDLTTHALCVGMTGSGKTGLCVSLLEEAAIDGIPVIAIDPKGDLGNLMLTFPRLEPADFAPWIDAGEAMRKGKDAATYAKDVAALWRKGLGSWNQDGSRIQRFKDSCQVSIYTPGSQAGLPITVLRSFSAPPESLRSNLEALGERTQSAVSGLLALIGVDADPLRSREHILLSNIVSRAWQEGKDLQIGDLIRAIQDPDFDKIGFFDVESFYPSKDRFELAMRINNLLASPGFASWMQGEALDVQRLLWTPEGKPRISILSIAHLSDAERMFFVTILLNEVVSWMRAQTGTTSLRALLYMDEVFGYFPPTANPPSKKPMLTLLKQARAVGLGCVLATQNPVDLDYKGLSNCGTWFLGRLQTERDKARVLEGLEGASATAGAAFDRQEMEATLARLGSRVFLMNNVHEDRPVLFHTRWAMSYLRGPISRDQISSLMAPQKSEMIARSLATPGRGNGATSRTDAPASAEHARPVLPPEIPDYVWPFFGRVKSGQTLLYRPALLGEARLHYVSARDDVDEWRQARLLVQLAEDPGGDPWADAERLEHAPELEDEPFGDGARFSELPAAAAQASSFKSWVKRLDDALYREETVTIWKCKLLKEASEPGESEGDFRARLSQRVRELRDEKIEKLRAKYAPKLARLQDRIEDQMRRVEKEEAQYGQRKLDTAVSLGTTILGALFGRKVRSRGNVGRAASSVRSASRAAKERGDIAHAKEKLEGLRKDLGELEEDFADATRDLEDDLTVDTLELTEKVLRPRKSDIEIVRSAIVWVPYILHSDGRAESVR